MYEEIEVEFDDMTSTKEWVSEDDDIQDVLVAIAESCNMSADSIIRWSYTGNEDDN